ncbi:MAG: four helix bundle protein [Gemmatimonadaceae bacterium]
MYPLHKLKVYEQARDLARACFVAGSSIRDRDLRGQLLRAARAIPANLAEGADSESQAVFARYIAIALASVKETECHLQIAYDAGLVAPAQHAALQANVDNLAPRVVRLLHAVRQNAKRRIREIP